MNKRTSFITAGAVTGVLLAGTAAVGANIGILNAADNGDVGQLSAAVATTPVSVPTSVEPQVIDIYLDEPVETTPTTAPPVTALEATTQDFAIDVAGTVSVETTDTGVFLDGVVVAEGWSWTSSHSANGELQVTFTSADSEYVFYASLAEDGTITARLDEPIVRVVQVPAAPSSTSGANSGANPAPSNTVPSGSYEDDDGYDDEDDEHDEHDEHEGGDDDD